MIAQHTTAMQFYCTIEYKGQVKHGTTWATGTETLQDTYRVTVDGKDYTLPTIYVTLGSRVLAEDAVPVGSALAAVVAEAAAKATCCPTRFAKAVALLASGGVELLDEHHATVLASDGVTRYTVNGACTCPDKAAWCKHRIAVELVRRAGRAATKAQAVPEAAPRQPKPLPAPALPEAPVSANTRLMVQGHEVQWTVRGHTVEEVGSKLEGLLAQYSPAKR